ncbi:MAG: PilZ domain-containing protein [Deltaproteobacteria bacterium]|jgi:hypothetical protein|nr:PilZ domain-containing protein [Deltaproteobacteria bacterium]
MSESLQTLAAPGMPSDDEAEKRIYQRLPRTYPVEVMKLSFPMPREGLQTKCCDISKGGVCVEAPSTAGLTEGDTCQLKALIPLFNKFSQGFFKVYENDAEQYFTALSEVSWIKPLPGQCLIGFKFVNVHDDQMAALEKLIERAFAQN